MNNNSMEAPAGSEERLTVPEWRGEDIDCERGGKANETHRTEMTRKVIDLPHGFVDRSVSSLIHDGASA